jgi:hypothetical protein
MNHLIRIAAVLAIACAPAGAGATSPKHHRPHHRHAARAVPATSAPGGVARIFAPLDPPSCEDPNVVSIENCRASSNGQR